MIPIDNAPLSLINCDITPLISNNLFPSLIDCIDKARINIYAIQYQWKWNIHERHSKIQQLGDCIARARRRNVAVSVILNQGSPSQHLAVINKVTGDRLSDLGCSVRLRHCAGLIHTKLWIIDNEFTFIGSHNVSTRSLTVNEEVTVKISSKEIACIMKEYFARLW